ncbi:MAG TPA: UDP-N-acetylmuramoyl-L-alanyl-D-glutamate--2,6-diaminopimelate ligase [Jatrophihabitantaceae bacterium]|nr:UDP-N-acetylmuramoyl-L-alanyl-D-glutamate--2,6-diaminopimelate ligase [Jatrophihabitantaceae bacterium]
MDPVPLSTLAHDWDGQLGAPDHAVVDGDDARVTGISATSSWIRPGDLFAALPGRATHGARFASDAIDRGAVAVLSDSAGRQFVPAGVPVVVVPDVRAVLGQISARVYGHPSRSMRMLGVTGTSGKTTTTFFLRAALAAAGRTTGLIGTVATYIGDEELKSDFTTPEAPEVQALLAVMRERGVSDVAMEVSSHALDMGRVGGIQFDVGAFTNLSQDHLDYHPDMTAYFLAKAKLFDQTDAPVVVIDDEWGRKLSFGELVTTVGVTNPGDWWAEDIVEHADGSTTFTARRAGPDVRAGTAIPGRFNVTNALLAIAMLERVGIDPQRAADAIETTTVPGRMERIDSGQPFLAVVDYSHKPAAIEGALAALRPLTRGRLIVVLGSGGDRDHAKRPIMGEIAARDADVLIVTDDNPRSEDAATIRAAMLDGARSLAGGHHAEVREVGDRTEAIQAAVELARAGDTVLVAGKGHETGQEIAGVVHPFDDRDVLRTALTRVAG